MVLKNLYYTAVRQAKSLPGQKGQPLSFLSSPTFTSECYTWTPQVHGCGDSLEQSYMYFFSNCTVFETHVLYTRKLLRSELTSCRQRNLNRKSPGVAKIEEQRRSAFMTTRNCLKSRQGRIYEIRQNLE